MNWSPHDLQTVFWSLTSRCNLKCQHCYAAAGEHGQDIPKEVVLQCAREAMTLGVKEFVLSGGEPFCRGDIFEILDALEELKIHFNFSTNGTLITDRVAQRLSNYSCYSGMQISLDGGKRCHDAFRGRKGAFELAIRGIEAMVKVGLYVMANCTISRINIGEIDKLSNVARKYQIKMRLTPLNPQLGRATRLSDAGLSIDELARLVDDVHKLKGEQVDIFLNLPPTLVPPEDVRRLGFHGCGWPRQMVGVLADGRVSICPLADGVPEFCGGNLLETSFTDVWTRSEVFKKIRQSEAINLTGVCSVCIIRDQCGGMCRLAAYLAYGSLTAPLPICQAFYDHGLFPRAYLTGNLSR